MDDDQPPQLVYYTTVQLPDGRIESPHFLVFDKLAEGVTTVKEHYRDLGIKLERLVMKEALFINTRVMPDEAYVLVPSNDNGVEDDFRDPSEQQNMVLAAEEGDTEEAILSLLPYEQENDDLLCRAFYMGRYVKAEDEDAFVAYLEDHPFEVSQPVDYLWLYRPTGEWKEVKV